MQRRVQEEPAGAMRPHSSGMWVPSPQRKPEWPYRKVVWCLRMENTLGMRAVPLYLSVAALTWSRAVPPHSLTAQRRRCPCRGAGNQVHRAGVGCQGRAEAGLVVCRQDCMWHLGFFWSCGCIRPETHSALLPTTRWLLHECQCLAAWLCSSQPRVRAGG